MSFSYVLAFVDYWPHVDGTYTSHFTHHSITNLKVLTIFYDCCVCGLSCDCGLNCETAIRRNATALMRLYIDLGVGIVLISLVSLPYILAFMDYWPHVARKCTSFLNIVSV